MLDIDGLQLVGLVRKPVDLFVGFEIVDLKNATDHFYELRRFAVLFLLDADERAEVSANEISRCSFGFSRSINASPA